MEDFELINTNDKELVEFTREQNSVVWKGILSTEDYLLRDHVSGQEKMYSNPPCYILINKKTGEKVCSLEIAVRDGVRFDKVEGKVVQTKIPTGCIGSVFTYPDYRGKGYAKIMIDKLIEICKEDLIKDGFISLYSEIGEYYTKCGFKSVHVPLLTRAVKEESPKIFKSGQDKYEIDGIDVSLVKYREFDELMKFYKDFNYKEIESKCIEDGKSRVTIDVNHDIINWFHIRAKFISYKTFYNNKTIDFDNLENIIDHFKDIEPMYLGIRFQHNGKQIGYVTWTFEWTKTPKGYDLKLYILHLFTLPEYSYFKSNIIDILDDYLRFLNITSKFGTFKVISAWSSDISNEQFKGTEKVNDSLSAILFTNNSDQSKLLNGDLVWENNNRIPWF